MSNSPTPEDIYAEATGRLRHIEKLLKQWVERELAQRAKNPMKDANGVGCATPESEATKACRVELFHALQPAPQV